MEDFYFEEHNTRNFFLKFLLFLLIVGLLIGGFLYYKKEYTIRLKKVTIEIGEELSTNVEDYLVSGKKNSKKYKLYLDNVDTATVGEYKYKVKYNKFSKKGTIKVVDTTSPKVVLDDITIGVKEEFKPEMLLISCTDHSLPCSISFENDNDISKLKTAGIYRIKFGITDKFGNITKETANIKVSETETLSSKMTNDLEYFNNSENIEIEHTLFRKFDKAIFEDTLEYEGVIQEISALDFTEYVTGTIYSTKIITAYNKYGYVIGIQVEVTFEDGTKTLVEDKKVIDNE